MEFPDFPFRSEYPSFLTHELLSEYLSSYSKHFELDKYIKVAIMARFLCHATVSGGILISSVHSSVWMPCTKCETDHDRG